MINRLSSKCAVVLLLFVEQFFVHNAFSQSLVEAMASTYYSNPDLLASRAVLRQTDENLQQAVSNWRPKVTLSVEYNKIQNNTTAFPQAVPTYYPLNGRTTVL